VAHLEARPGCLVGPVTNRTGNEAQVTTSYRTLGGFLDAAARRAAEHDGETFSIPTLTMFCLAMTAADHAAIGPLDERFEVGLLEDDDYALRARRAGRELVCAQDVLVHHFGEASFGRLVPSGERERVLGENKRRFAEKWGRAWPGYARRQDDEYVALRERVRRMVDEHVPADATVLVISRGDDELVRLERCRGWHFPQGEGGVWAGHYPSDSAAAVAELEALRDRGARYLVVPPTAQWWLEHYDGLRAFLDRRERVAEETGTAVLYALDGRGA
jgi:hypothetical protein